MLRLRPGLLLVFGLLIGVWVWQTQFREYSPFSGSATEHAQQVEFKRYVLDYYPIQKVEYHGSGEIWVRLKVGEKLQPVDAQRVVDDIADDYRTRTNTTGGITVYLLHPVDQGVMARASR